MRTKDRCRQRMVSVLAATHRASVYVAVVAAASVLVVRSVEAAVYRSVMAVVAVAVALLLATAMDARAQLTAIDASCTGGRFAGLCDTQPDGGSAVDGDDDGNGDLENDNRPNLLTSAYLGTAIDNFAGSEILTYLNPEDAGPTEQRLRTLP